MFFARYQDFFKSVQMKLLDNSVRERHGGVNYFDSQSEVAIVDAWGQKGDLSTLLFSIFFCVLL
jgi:hypothetical protein